MYLVEGDIGKVELLYPGASPAQRFLLVLYQVHLDQKQRVLHVELNY